MEEAEIEFNRRRSQLNICGKSLHMVIVWNRVLGLLKYSKSDTIVDWHHMRKNHVTISKSVIEDFL